ncbi:MAG: hypothetical protein ACLQGP_30315 [Isosphaeraceae bacterium]
MSDRGEWNAWTWRPFVVRNKAPINALAFAPDGSTLASCGHEGAVRLCRAGPMQPVPAR